VAGGLLVAALVGTTWHAFFVVSAVITLLGLAGTVAFVKDSPARARGGLDIPGAALLTATMIALLLGFSEGPTWGWDSAAVLALLFGGAALGVTWWLTERAARVPLIQVSYLTRRDVGVPYAITFLIAFGIYGSLSAATRLAQTPVASGYGWGWSTLAVGWFALPQIIAALLAIVALRAARRHGLPPVAVVALAIIVIGFAAYAFGHGVHVLFLTGTGLEGCGPSDRDRDDPAARRARRPRRRVRHRPRPVSGHVRGGEQRGEHRIRGALRVDDEPRRQAHTGRLYHRVRYLRGVRAGRAWAVHATGSAACRRRGPGKRACRSRLTAGALAMSAAGVGAVQHRPRGAQCRRPRRSPPPRRGAHSRSFRTVSAAPRPGP
jgi:hypothetical protein